MKFFIYDQSSGKLVLNKEEIFVLSEFKALINSPKRAKLKDKMDKVFREFTYIYLFFDWESPYFQYLEQDRHRESLTDAGLTEKEFDDPLFRAACRKYDEIQNASKIGRLLKASYSTIDKITHYLENLNLEERDEATGKPIFKTKDVIAEISSAGKLYDSVKTLEISFKKDLETDNPLRGDISAGLFD
jgi:hypothetical protein